MDSKKAVTSLHDGIESLRGKENPTTLEKELLFDYIGWDKGDCSVLGLIKLYFKYLLKKELLDVHTSRDPKKLGLLIKALDNGLD